MQASKKQIKETLIDQLHVHYRCRWDSQTIPAEYGQVVSDLIDAVYDRQISPEQLADGTKTLKADWKYQRWPTEAELLKYFQPPPQLSSRESVKKGDRESWAETVMRSDEGQRALQQGYGRELYVWARRNQGLMPTQYDISDLCDEELKFRAKLREQIDAARKMEKSRDEPMKSLARASLLNAASAMNAAENKLKKDFMMF